ncbi:MAG: septum formation initiator family protein [Candidatus Hydrogenedentes bacterium]|nr:septum formation initiator family protein [Candidatus Hydrogenedentota bacterium]
MPRRSKGWYWLATALFAVGLAAFAKHHDLTGLYRGYQHSEREVRNLELRLESLRAEKVALSKSVQGLNAADSLEIEAEIRSTGLVKKGETVYRFGKSEDFVP